MDSPKPSGEVGGGWGGGGLQVKTVNPPSSGVIIHVLPLSIQAVLAMQATTSAVVVFVLTAVVGGAPTADPQLGVLGAILAPVKQGLEDLGELDSLT